MHSRYSCFLLVTVIFPPSPVDLAGGADLCPAHSPTLTFAAHLASKLTHHLCSIKDWQTGHYMRKKMSLFQCRLEGKSSYLCIYPSHQAILTFAATCGTLHRLSHHRSLTAGFADCAKGLQTAARWCRVAETVHISCQTNTYTEDFKRIAGTSNSQSPEVLLSKSWVTSQWVCLWFLLLFICSTKKS